MLKKPTFKKPTFLIFAATIMLAGSLAFAQNPPPRGERRGDGDPEHGERLNQIDRNRDGAVDLEEFKADSAHLFQESDRNNDGVIDETEMMPPPRDENFGGKPGGEELPPFLRTADKNRDGKITRAEFDEDTPLRFAAFDKNHDGVLGQDEFSPMPPRREGSRGGNPPNSSMIEFLGAEMRFGDKLVKNAPFSAVTVMENTRRLYDGSTVTRQSKGAIYRDTEGRTRREQTLDSIGSFSVSEGQKLIFISDVVGKTQYFVDQNRKTARRMELRGGGGNPPDVPRELKDGNAKTESLGTKTIDGISAEGTRTVIEISAGQVGNDKPLQIISERWFSPELQLVLMSRHVDPLSGEQVFRLENIKRSEPAAELFSVPKDFKIETGEPRRDEKRSDGRRDEKRGGERRPE